MSIFGNILDKIFHQRPSVPAAAPTSTGQQPSAPFAPVTPAAPSVTESAAATTPPPSVDVEAVLTEMAAMKAGGGGNWRTSINDLLRLLDLENSLAARHELAEELGVHSGADGTAEQNIALHKAVMKKLAENGGVVPDSLRD